MESINNLKQKMTIILIAHRLTTVKNCDKIFLLQNGKLKAEDTYKNLLIKMKTSKQWLLYEVNKTRFYFLMFIQS